MQQPTKHIAIIGAGLVGSLLSVYLARRGYQVSVFERRADVRSQNSDHGRSINLALSTRGIRALDEVGLGGRIKQMAIPMHGRVMHDQAGDLSFLPYGRQGQYINSISRSGLNAMLIDAAEKHGVVFYFQHRCLRVDLLATTASLEKDSDAVSTQKFDLIIGADGAFSAVRAAMQITDGFDFSQQYLEHGYKELLIPANASGKHRLEKNALHIWPRESFMMIALPNPDGSFTCTLFLPFKGPVSFESLTDDRRVRKFFEDTFPDALNEMPSLSADFNSNPTSSLVTIKCFPWSRNKTLLIGDAAHGIVPFYGQGMNAGFEDCRILNTLLDEDRDDWRNVLGRFQGVRKKDCDAIAELAVHNFIEMRDLVADPDFLLQKKIEARLHELYPDKWIPLYSMVTFHDEIPYAQAYATGLKQAKIMEEVMRRPDIANSWQELNFREIADALA